MLGTTGEHSQVRGSQLSDGRWEKTGRVGDAQGWKRLGQDRFKWNSDTQECPEEQQLRSYVQ